MSPSPLRAGKPPPAPTVKDTKPLPTIVEAGNPRRCRPPSIPPCVLRDTNMNTDEESARVSNTVASLETPILVRAPRSLPLGWVMVPPNETLRSVRMIPIPPITRLAFLTGARTPLVSPPAIMDNMGNGDGWVTHTSSTPPSETVIHGVTGATTLTA